MEKTIILILRVIKLFYKTRFQPQKNVFPSKFSSDWPKILIEFSNKIEYRFLTITGRIIMNGFIVICVSWRKENVNIEKLHIYSRPWKNSNGNNGKAKGVWTYPATNDTFHTSWPWQYPHALGCNEFKAVQKWLSIKYCFYKIYFLKNL